MSRNSFVLRSAALALMTMAVGCATSGSQPMYYWGDYSESLYQSKKHPSPETLAEHKSVLEKIVETSQEKNCRIPPGVYAELGYLYAMQNDPKKAIALFTLEKQTYPEATVFMDRLIQRSERKPESEKAAGDGRQPVADKPHEAGDEPVGVEGKTK